MYGFSLKLPMKVTYEGVVRLPWPLTGNKELSFLNPTTHENFLPRTISTAQLGKSWSQCWAGWRHLYARDRNLDREASSTAPT